jgi:hypothetical protein
MLVDLKVAPLGCSVNSSLRFLENKGMTFRDSAPRLIGVVYCSGSNINETDACDAPNLGRIAG